MTLQALQRAFMRAVRSDPTPHDARMYFVGDSHLSVEDRLRIYRNMYWRRQVHALGESFPRLAQQLGEESFSQLACRYLRAHPSRHPALEHLGGSLSQFLDVDIPRWASLAKLEWHRNLALLAPDAGSLCDMSAVEPRTFGFSRLRLAPSLSLIESDGEALHAFDSSWPVTAAPVQVAVFRKGFVVRHLILSSYEARALRHAQAGGRMEQVLAGFAADESGTRQAFEMLRSWFSRAWIEAIDR